MCVMFHFSVQRVYHAAKVDILTQVTVLTIGYLLKKHWHT